MFVIKNAWVRCNMYGEDDHTTFWSENFEEGHNFVDRAKDGKILLK
jgi:hypothetical protein